VERRNPRNLRYLIPDKGRPHVKSCGGGTWLTMPGWTW
jgi:hypothetical protein